VLVLARDDLEEQGLSSQLVDQIAGDPVLVRQVPVAQTTGSLIHGYLKQTSGIYGQAAKVERSFGGDLVHSFYLSHVDLWRGDRRFSHLVRSCQPEIGHKVIANLADLPDAIANHRNARVLRSERKEIAD
jgi:hypothetical protein